MKEPPYSLFVWYFNIYDPPPGKKNVPLRLEVCYDGLSQARMRDRAIIQ